MARWEYDVVRMDTLELFQGHCELLGNQGFEMVSAQFAIWPEERPVIPPGVPEWTQSKMIPARPVWMAFFKRAVDDD
jgi:hypothetical protein